MDGYNMLLPIEKFLPISVERPDLLEVLYQETEIVNPLGDKEFNDLPISKEYIENTIEREKQQEQYAKEAEERANHLRQVEADTGKNPLAEDENETENIIISER